MSTDQHIEQEIQAKGLTAPRVTPADVEAEIVSEHYFVAGDGVYGAAHKAGDHEVQSFPQALDLLTFCVLRLRNGFTVTGESACVSAKNFDPEIGRSIAREKAVDKVWQLLGFRLADALSGKGLTYPKSVTFRARVAHEVNRAYCQAIGDDSQVPWDEAPDWQRNSAMKGVVAANNGATPEQLHESWCAQKLREGWKHGPVKDPEAKTHPCLVPYEQLPAAQRIKDHLFRAAVLI